MVSILLADENPVTLEVLKESLETEGHQVRTTSVHRAIPLWQKHRKDIDVIVTGKSMGRDENAGVDLAVGLRKLKCDIPIILQSDTITPDSQISRFKAAGNVSQKNIFLDNISLKPLLKAIENCTAASVQKG